jgi:putative transposase
MASRRWIVPWRNSTVKPVIYHCVSRVVDRRLAFGPVEKEKFRTFMRMQESFTGCRVLSYCLMSNHIHLLLEVPPMPEGGLSDELLLARLRAIYGEAFVGEVAGQLAEARRSHAETLVADIHSRFTYRMHDLSEFMKTLMQRFTKWFNKSQQRRGNLWEDAFTSVVVEDGIASKTMAAYIDLNPVRAGIVKEPAAYRWSSYGEAIGGGPRGNGKKARAGLVRAFKAHQGVAADESFWANGVDQEYRKLLMRGAVEKSELRVDPSGKIAKRILRKGGSKENSQEMQDLNETSSEIPFAEMLGMRIRYFSDGVVIGSREFVNDVFAGSRGRFGENRKSGARKLRGNAAPASGMIWSIRDLRTGISDP